MDEIVIKQRSRTTLVAGRPSTWTEIEVATEGTGAIAVFRPSDEEVERGEADLSVEHLIAEAERLRSDLVRLRAAFRSARDAPEPHALLRPLYGEIWSDDGSVYRRPTVARGGAFVLSGVAVGLLGASASSLLTAALSVVLMVYGGIGVLGLAEADGQIGRSRGLHVPILAGPEPYGRLRDVAREFSGPYSIHPRIIVHASGRDFVVEPSVEVSDATGGVVWRRSGRQYDGATAEQAAVMMLREADELVAELTQGEEDVAQPLRHSRWVQEE